MLQENHWPWDQQRERIFSVMNTIRYKKKHESVYTVGDVTDMTDHGFCLLMPIDLELDQEFQFEAFNGGSSIKGDARVLWMDHGRVRAGCFYTIQRGKAGMHALSSQW